eukprot:scaffold1598_cov100-Skeletonema_dohrnii-CCMP3373.AAC.1
MPLLHELINFPEGKCTHHLLANNKQPCRWLNSAGRPLSYRRLQQYSPAHIAAAPSRLTSSFMKQARRYTYDQKMRSSNNFSTVEAGAIQIGPAPWKP